MSGLLAMLAVIACGGPSPAPVDERVAPPVAPLLTPLSAADDEAAGPIETGSDPYSGARSTDVDGPALVLLVVLDTVRADHTSLCGYDRPTTPWLAGLLRKNKSVAASCTTYAPGVWTTPSHVSFFSGLPVPEHGVDAAGLSVPAHLPLLAERMAARGYQTLAISANPTLRTSEGLLRGFDRWVVARNLTALRGDALVEIVQAELAQLDPDRPVFLFVNNIDAHDPWPAVPDGLPWVPAQRSLGFDVHAGEQDGPYHRFVRSELAPEEAATFAARVQDVYDHGVHIADRTANRIVGTLQSEGWTDGGWRMVLTSDHGEFLGEHSLLRHGCYPWDPVARVPLVVVDTTQAPPDLSGPISGLQVHSLVQTGQLLPNLDAASFSRRRLVDPKMGADTVALWPGGTDKLLWFEGQWLHYDLGADPGEMGREPLGEHPARSRLERWVAAQQAHLAERAEVDAGQVEALRRLGYVE